MLQRVPKTFVDKYWKAMPNPAVITLPNGFQQDGEISFQKNWEKIAKFLKSDYAVVFKYVGGSFKLKIFGHNYLEIYYSKFIDEVTKDDEFAER
jgi:hypothetical protein